MMMLRIGSSRRGKRRLHPWEEKSPNCGWKLVRAFSRDAMKYTRTEIANHASGGLRYEAIGGCVFEKLGSFD